jgi:DNA-binding NtrC family response regulator
VFTQLEHAAGTDAGVLITGETGTGKEIAARAIHGASRRAAGPFVVLDCNSVVPQLFAATLFGCVKGAIAGIDEDRPGLVEQANGGTLFIDEVAALPLDLQPALLRLCDERTIMRVGEVARREVDVRIVAATRRDLTLEVAAGRFREDLYYRLKVLSIAMPPLRARREDFPQLVEEILHGLGVSQVGPLRGENMSRLLQHAWPGNVRELASVLGGAVAAAPGKSFAELTIGLVPRVAPDQVAGDESFQHQKKQAIDEFERAYLERLLSESGGNIRRACRASGIERTQLKRLLDKHGLR